MHEKQEALLLHSVPYLGKKKILKALTEEGLVTLMTTKPLSPFLHLEIVYRKTDREIHSLLDHTLLNPLLSLREDYTTLTAAGKIAQELLETQMPGKPAPFALALAYFKHLSINPTSLLASFRLKLQRFEGTLNETELNSEELALLNLQRFSDVGAPT